METKKQTENLLMLNAIIPKACKKLARNGKSQVFKKLYHWLLISLVISIERFTGINFVIAVTKTYFLHPGLSCRL